MENMEKKKVSKEEAAAETAEAMTEVKANELSFETANHEQSGVANDLDALFAFESEEALNDGEEPTRKEGEWVYPGPRLTREPFQYNGRTLYAYNVQMRIRVAGSDEPLKLRASLVPRDNKNRESYERLEMFFAMQPPEKRYLMLGFQYQEFTRSYNYSVEAEVGGVPLRVSLKPRNEQNKNDLNSIVAELRRQGLLKK